MLKVIEHPMLKKYLGIMRNKDTKTNDFSQAASSISEVLVYELLRQEPLKKILIDTPVKTGVEAHDLANDYVLVPIIRAGLVMLSEARRILSDAKVMHVGISRDGENEGKWITYLNKIKTTNQNAHAIVLDPMLATGNSAVATIKMLKQAGYQKISFLGIIGVQEGVNNLENNFGKDFPIYLAALDPELNSKNYIVPGLGDAGDRAFGTLD
ncbi:uracil phosphoribosyltransferase [Mycoplasmopsis agassizii]|uniref:uracil phosphoribosyltransferase n=1 Tax=Mycoplasmopsis agassizii TaxID=33922 RepID=A0ABX4H6P7_9BACT|nr:uracil phosphoribosyltransferase [Mycoplasmopsis agassizii]PAF55550.1 uracil phosphoribosyltransferase [Mycoplasmopsis agassizii]SMC17869.1 uracil phosphoribosyltransferase [Mycoplasmopsis agassizii]